MGNQGPTVPVTVTFAVPLAASTKTLGPAFGIGVPGDKIVVIHTLTGMSAGTLDLYLQESWDGGTSWSDVGHFSQLSIGAAAATQRRVIASTGTAVTVAKGDTPSIAANTFCDAPWGPLLRIVSVTGVNTNAAPVNQVLTFLAWQQSH